MLHPSETAAAAAAATTKDPTTKPFKPNLMQSLLGICIVTALSLCYYASQPISRFINCPECDKTLIHTFYNLHSLTTSAAAKHRPPPPPPPQNTTLSHVLFGIGGSSDTWTRRRLYTELWFNPNTTRGYVWLDTEPKKQWPSTSPPYKVSSDTSRFKYTNWYGTRSAVRISRIVKESFELGLDNVRWFVMGDDDTVFFVENLLTVLNKYDHRQMHYIGSITESVEQAVYHSYSMGYGGGGFAISYPLARELVRILDGCIDRYADLYGSDHKVGACINEIGVPLTKELGFHQVDIRGSPYGLLAAHPLTPLVSVHHLDYVQPLFPGHTRVNSVKRLIQASKHDPSRTVQQTFCYDLRRKWSISISWGYTAQLYPFIVTAKDLSTPLQTFLTFGTWSQEPFTFNTRVMSLNPCERPIVFYYEGLEGFKNGTLSWYKRTRLSRTRKQCEGKNFKAAYKVKGFNVSAPILDPGIWRSKAPRRQCCEIINGSDQLDGLLQVKIRGCQQHESVTPP